MFRDIWTMEVSLCGNNVTNKLLWIKMVEADRYALQFIFIELLSPLFVFISVLLLANRIST